MVTDPRTIPNARAGRLIWAGSIALLAFILRNVFFLPTAVLWALFFLAPLTPLLDRLFPADRFAWLPTPTLSPLPPLPPSPPCPHPPTPTLPLPHPLPMNTKPLRLLASLLLACVACLILAPSAWAFCGFYVAKADSKLYNQASQVAIARSGNDTVLTMANDFQGEVKDFAIVVPVPVVLQKDQIKVANPKIIERLDAFSAPRLVEYFDPDPCEPPYDRVYAPAPSVQASGETRATLRQRQDALGVTIEARYTVGEYDILILSAKESGGLQTWLSQNGYQVPPGAKQLLQPYIRQQMKFFVAKVNLKEFDKSGFQSLRPLQIAYESPRFMLPIRLGMVNAQSMQGFAGLHPVPPRVRPKSPTTARSKWLPGTRFPPSSKTSSAISTSPCSRLPTAAKDATWRFWSMPGT